MGSDATNENTAVTRPSDSPSATATMSFTGVTSRQQEATRFLKELLRAGQKLIPDRVLSIEDLVAICHLALNDQETGTSILEGRHLRTRISEQISRADRYDETFSLAVLKIDGETPSTIVYDSIIDTLCERLRQTDLMFLFKQRIALLLPHTHEEAVRTLSSRIQSLLAESIQSLPNIAWTLLTYPNADTVTIPAVLDWAEDQLRV